MLKIVTYLFICSVVLGLCAQATVFAQTVTLTATVTTQNISVSVSPGSISWGTLGQNTASSTNPAFSQTATNGGNIAEDFNIRGQNSADWTLAATTGTNQYVESYCTTACTAAPTNFSALTTNYQTLKTNVSASGTQRFDVYLVTPNPSTSFTQQSVDITLQAVAH